ncbi:hypothetical protein E8E14_010548 [Neopestalotiopsis sp. 37M]|nr:hypothetical protein E8E14_010548 [Neopestalotiopsis sp. 37M]
MDIPSPNSSSSPAKASSKVMDCHRNDASVAQPRGIELLQNDLRVMIFTELDFESMSSLALTSKAWSNTYSTHEKYINRNVLRRVIGSDNLSIAIARHAASQLTWTPSLFDGVSGSISPEELPGKVKDFGEKYLVPGAHSVSEFGYAMAKDMTDFHQYVEKWSVSYQRDWYYNELSEPKNDQEMSIFQNLMYILETMRLLLPVHLQFELDDDFEKDNKIFAALCHFFPPWLFNIIQEIELNMSDICPDWYAEWFTDSDLDENRSFVELFSILGAQEISQNRTQGALYFKSLVTAMLQARNKDHFPFYPRCEYSPAPGEWSWLAQPGTMHHIQRADIEGLLSKYPEIDPGPADLWLYKEIRYCLLGSKLPMPLLDIDPHTYDRKTLDDKYGKSFPSRDKLIDNLVGARVDYLDGRVAHLRPACAVNCRQSVACPRCRI